RLLESTDLRGALPTLAKPSLWIAGQRDRLVSPAAMQAAAALAPGAQALTIAHGGHAPFLGHADEVAAAVAYLASPAAAAVTGTALAVDGGMQGLRLRPASS
ncbi:SDR family oxidoreductase, partial [Streptomyces albiflaviniger]|nr:SDR family oxidoreductase [Streptomyces albiflaviniger]